MSIQQDAQAAANVAVGGTDRSGLFYDSTTHVWRTKNQAGTLANLVNGVDSVSNSDTSLTISPTTGAVVASLKAVYKANIDNWFNKAFYNVLDNGITAAGTGAANVTAWNALMTAITDGATVLFPAGTYQFASELAIPSGKHIRVVGAGKNGKTIIQTTSATANIFSCGDWYQEFEGLSFSSSVTRTTGAAILSGNNVGINVVDCSFAAMFNGVVFSGGASAGNIGFVENCSFTNTVNFSIQVDGTNANAYIAFCTADCSPATVCHLEVNACGSLVVTSCDFIRATNNMRLNPDSGTKGVFSVYCTDVFFDTAAGSSVKYLGGAAGTNIQRVKFVNCWLSGSVTGCEFAANSSTNKATATDFVNCDIYSNSANGILATEVQDFSLNNCRIAGNSTAGINILATAGSVTKFNIQNCAVGPTAGVGGNGIGINIQSGVYGSYTITGNNVAGNTSNNNIIDLGTVATTDLKKVADNLGHLLKGAIATLAAPLSVPVTTETLVLSARIPANAVLVGQVFRCRAIAVMAGANAVTWRIRVGAVGTVAGDTVVAWLPTASPVGVANGRHGCEVYLTVRSATTVQAEGLQQAGTATTTINFQQPALGAAATGVIASTAVWFIDISLSQTVNSSLVQQAVIEAL